MELLQVAFSGEAGVTIQQLMPSAFLSLQD